MLLAGCCRNVDFALQKCLGQGMDFQVLGPVEIWIDGRSLSLGGPKQRALLALLLLNRNEVVSRDQLVDSLWGERPPESAQRSLDTYVSRLRTLLGGDRIERRRPGYLLRVEPGELDLERFETLLEQGRGAAAAGDPATARDRLVESLGVWRGSALAGVASELALAGEARELEERRLLAIEARTDAQLALGGGPELVGELERLTAAHPFRERLLGQLMLSLFAPDGRRTRSASTRHAGAGTRTSSASSRAPSCGSSSGGSSSRIPRSELRTRRGWHSRDAAGARGCWPPRSRWQPLPRAPSWASSSAPAA
jgi:DNA-binding SARP family transcriptional activator